MTNPNASQQYQKGATVIVDPDAEPRHGKIVIARLDGTNEATVKKLVIDGPSKVFSAIKSSVSPTSLSMVIALSLV
ncbi:Repressor protein C2 [Escherichia coli]|uniref:Repressor protein C2 n=1 Tax=Escherichia coli TaxID=562 RepID=A0A2X3M313_ECOLX|nr:Repressor protein C2 [Escherichia coli]